KWEQIPRGTSVDPSSVAALRLARPRSADQRGRAVSRHAGDNDYLAAVRLDHLPADDLLGAVVAALDQHARPHLLDHRERGILAEDDHEIDRLERGKHFRARLLVLDRAPV